MDKAAKKADEDEQKKKGQGRVICTTRAAEGHKAGATKKREEMEQVYSELMLRKYKISIMEK